MKSTECRNGGAVSLPIAFSLITVLSLFANAQEIGKPLVKKAGIGIGSGLRYSRSAR